jgi:arginyl-tRNA synthetase
MKPADTVLTDILRTAAKDAWPDLSDLEPITVQAATKPEFGDYQCNAAMSLTKVLKTKPRETAEKIVAALPGTSPLEKAEVAGPGFINLTLSRSWLEQSLAAMRADERLGVEPVEGDGTVVIDYSSPNVCKTMHVGHLRSTIIGHALARVHRFLGYEVMGDNHLGDWGTQFGILIMAYRRWGDEARLEADPVGELEALYKRGNEAAAEDPALREEARRELVKLHEGDRENQELWKRFVEYSMADMNRLYERMGVSFDTVRGESAYHDMLPGVVESLQREGVCRESEGAQVVFFSEEEGDLPPFIVRKQDGAFNYATTDIATVRHRLDTYAPNKILYVTDARQQLHFRQLFATIHKLGWDRDVELEHLWFGSILGGDGKPLKTREGTPPKLWDLLDEAERRASEVVREASQGFSDEEQRNIARAAGTGALFYADLAQNRQSDYVFSYDRMLALDGNTAPYIMYTYARSRSIRRKFEDRFGVFDEGTEIRIEEPAERALAVHLVRFPGMIRDAAAGYKLNLITDYVYQLATTLNKQFYHQVPVLQSESPVRESRLALTELVARALKTGLGLLGIETPERM